MSPTLLLATFCLALLPSASSNLACYSCSEYNSTSATLRQEVVDGQGWGLLTGAYNRSCTTDSIKRCPAAKDICIFSTLAVSSLDEGALGTIQVYHCARSWMDKNFCDKAVTGMEGAGLQAECYKSSCSGETKCNIPQSVWEEVNAPEDAESEVFQDEEVEEDDVEEDDVEEEDEEEDDADEEEDEGTVDQETESENDEREEDQENTEEEEDDEEDDEDENEEDDDEDDNEEELSDENAITGSSFKVAHGAIAVITTTFLLCKL